MTEYDKDLVGRYGIADDKAELGLEAAAPFMLGNGHRFLIQVDGRAGRAQEDLNRKAEDKVKRDRLFE